MPTGIGGKILYTVRSMLSNRYKKDRNLKAYSSTFV